MLLPALTADYLLVVAVFQIFIGMGFPYEGPAPLEALAEGCVFFNAKFDPPHNGKNTEFFKSKPTHRKVNKLFMITFISFIRPMCCNLSNAILRALFIIGSQPIFLADQPVALLRRRWGPACSYL